MYSISKLGSIGQFCQEYCTPRANCHRLLHSLRLLCRLRSSQVSSAATCTQGKKETPSLNTSPKHSLSSSTPSLNCHSSIHSTQCCSVSLWVASVKGDLDYTVAVVNSVLEIPPILYHLGQQIESNKNNFRSRLKKINHT